MNATRAFFVGWGIVTASVFASDTIRGPSGDYTITQSAPDEHPSSGGELWREAVRFERHRHRPEVVLPGYSWAGIYSFSPDERWLLRIQKVASGENEAILYKVDDLGRVLEVVGFNAILWSAVRTNRSELYHMTTYSPTWSSDGHLLSLMLSASPDSNRAEDGVHAKVTYDLSRNVVTKEAEPARPADAPSSHR